MAATYVCYENPITDESITYVCYENPITVESITETTPDPLRRDHHVNFEFKFMTGQFYWHQNPNSPSPPIYHSHYFSDVTTASIGVTISGAAPYLRMRTAMEKAMAPQSLTESDLQFVISTAINAAHDEITRITDEGAPTAVCVDLVFQVFREYHYVYDDDGEEDDDDSEEADSEEDDSGEDDSGEDDWMVPAADSSLEFLEKYEVGSGSGSGSGSEDDAITESCCCVCLEEYEDGEVVLSMPCKHVFHEDCIKKWLKTSHYCPLCRFEM